MREREKERKRKRKKERRIYHHDVYDDDDVNPIDFLAGTDRLRRFLRIDSTSPERSP